MHCITLIGLFKVTHCTSPIKVGATVGIAFLHVKPDDEPHLEALSFKSRKSRKTDVGREESRIDGFVGFSSRV